MTPASDTKKKPAPVAWVYPAGVTGIGLFWGGLLLFAGMCVLVFLYGHGLFDREVARLITTPTTESRTRLMRAVSFFGNHQFLVPANILLVLYFAVQKNKWDAIRTAAVAFSSLGTMSLLKRSFQRHRPADPLVEGITNFSFPSGHAFMSVAFYGLLIVWVYMEMEGKMKRIILMLLLTFIILVIGYSRVYLRVHYGTDVLAGWSAGVAWLIAVLWICDRWFKKATAPVSE
jgi:undecaprenyl-diphosphatase